MYTLSIFEACFLLLSTSVRNAWRMFRHLTAALKLTIPGQTSPTQDSRPPRVWPAEVRSNQNKGGDELYDVDMLIR